VTTQPPGGSQGQRFSIDVSQVDRLAAKLGEFGRDAHKFGVASVRVAGLRGLALVKKNASGRPGPRVPTGDYRRSINVRFSDGGARAEIGTAAVQGHRLEYGFVGPDSLGRVYNQPPYPHFRPMRDQIEHEWVKIMSDIVRESKRKSGLR